MICDVSSFLPVRLRVLQILVLLVAGGNIIIPSTLGFLPPSLLPSIKHPGSSSTGYTVPSPSVLLQRTDSTDDDDDDDDHDHDRTTCLQSLRETLRRLRAELRAEATNDTGGRTKNDRNLSPDEWARETLLSTRIPGLPLRRTVVGPSTIPGAGRGLFAAQDIAEGELITCYPGDALVYTPPYADGDGNEEEEEEEEDDDDYGEDEDDEDIGDEIVVWGSHVSTVDRWDDSAVFDGRWETGDDDNGDVKPGTAANRRPLTDYALYVCDAYAVLGVPSLPVDPAYAGHYANDGAGGLAMGAGGIGEGGSGGVEEGIVAFIDESLRLANAQNRVVEDSHMGTIATRNIAEGEEIMVTYGIDYWLEHTSF